MFRDLTRWSSLLALSLFVKLCLGTKWEFQDGSLAVDEVNGCVPDSRGNLFVLGSTTGNLYGTASGGNWDIWISRLSWMDGSVLATFHWEGHGGHDKGAALSLSADETLLFVNGTGLSGCSGCGFSNALFNATTLEYKGPYIRNLEVGSSPKSIVSSGQVRYECGNTALGESLYATNAGGQDYWATKACDNISHYFINSVTCAPCPNRLNHLLNHHLNHHVTHRPTHPLNHHLNHRLNHLLNHRLNHPLTHPLNHPPYHPLNRLLNHLLNQ